MRLPCASVLPATASFFVSSASASFALASALPLALDLSSVFEAAIVRVRGRVAASSRRVETSSDRQRTMRKRRGTVCSSSICPGATADGFRAIVWLAVSTDQKRENPDGRSHVHFFLLTVYSRDEGSPIANLVAHPHARTMGLLKHTLTFIGTLFTVAGGAFMFAPADVVPAVYGQAMKAGSAYPWTRSGTFELAFGALLVMSRSWGAEERFKIGVVALLTLVGLLYNVTQHAVSSGMNTFALADPAYALVTALTVILVVGLVVNKMEPGVFEKDKGSKGTRKSTRVRTKRA